MKRLRLFLSGVGIVALQAANVILISSRHPAGAFVVSGSISFIWWDNARRASLSDLRFARETYAAGAAVGTVCTMALSSLFLR